MKEKRPPSSQRSSEAPLVGAASQPAVFVFRPFRLDARDEQLWNGQQRVPLRPKPFAILRYLVERPRQLITKDELLSALWPDEYVGEGILKTHLADIRRALGDSHKAAAFIETAHGRGYRFIGQLEETCPASDLPPSTRPRARSRGGPFTELPPFVGRGGELDRLEQLLEKAGGRERQVAFISGEAGIGKTLLARTFLQRVADRGDALLAWGQCVDQYGAGEPYLPIFEALGRLCRGPEASLVLELLKEHAPSWLALMPSAALQAGVPHAGLAAAPRRMLREMAEAVEALASERALVLWLDDLHWADPSTLDLIAYLAQRSDPARLLLLAGYRAPDAASTDRLPLLGQRLTLRDQSTDVALRYLDERDVAEYLAARFEHNSFPDALGPLLHRRTSGNPLFMVKLVDFWLERAALARGDDGWRLEGALDQLESGVPRNLTRMIEQQKAQLGDFERSVLEAASVAGPQFCTAELAAATGADVTRIEALCTSWSRSGQFLRLAGVSEWPDGTASQGAEFIHALYRHVVYAELGVALRAELHRRIAERKEAAYAARLMDVAAELAMHFERGQDPRRAVRYLRLAADQALLRSAFREAAEHLGKAVGLLPKLGQDPSTDARALELELCLPLGLSLAMSKGYAHPEVERVYVRARDLCQTLGETPRLAAALAGIGGFFILRGAHAQGVRSCEQMLGIAERFGDPDIEAEARFGLGMLQLFHAEVKAAAANFEATIACAERGRKLPPIVPYRQDPGMGARSFLAYALVLLGYPDRALSLAEECLTRARSLGRPFAVAFALQALEFVHEQRGEYEAARSRAGELLALCREHGFPLHEAVATLASGQACAGMGELETGIRLLQAGWGGYRLTGAEAGATYYQSHLVQAHTAAGNLAVAWQMLEEIKANIERLDERWWEAELYRLQGELLQKGSPSGAEAAGSPGTLEATERAFERALELARARHQRCFELRAATSLARFRCAQGKAEQARQLLGPIHGWFTEGRETLDLRHAKALLELIEAGRA